MRGVFGRIGCFGMLGRMVRSEMFRMMMMMMLLLLLLPLLLLTMMMLLYFCDYSYSSFRVSFVV